MTLPLNLIIDRTADGKLRAEVAGHPEFAVEATDFPGLLDAVRDTFLRFEIIDPAASDSGVLNVATVDAATQNVELALTDEEDRALRRVAMERMPDRETLEKLVSHHPVPEHWPEGDEDWDDAP